MELKAIDIANLSVSRLNMRGVKKTPDLTNILPSIRARGILVPLIVRAGDAPDTYEIVAGKRRYHAALVVAQENDGIDPLPCVVMAPGDDAAALEASLIENIARLDPDEMTQCETFTRLVPERSPADYAIHDPANSARPIVGKVITRGLSDEHADRQYLIVDGTEGLSHYIDIGIDAPATLANAIVRITPARIAIRPVDHNIAAVAAANDGSYTIDLHLRHDPTATEDFARTHERRLEAMRRATDSVERRPDGTWVIAPDHLARVEAWERDKLSKAPVVIEALSAEPLQELARQDGPTWLDSELTAKNPTPIGRGFGTQVRQALDLRRQWLVEQELATIEGDTIRLRGNLMSTLQQRELRRVAGQLSQELGLGFVETKAGQAIEGTYRRSVQVGTAKYALIEKSRDFTLVPWRPVLEHAIGKRVSGIMRETGGISWTIGRSRGLGIE